MCYHTLVIRHGLMLSLPWQEGLILSWCTSEFLQKPFSFKENFFVWSSLLSLAGLILSPIKDYLESKKEERKAQHELEIATLHATTERIKSDNDSRSEELKVRLDSTTRQFKQSTFYWLLLPVLFTVIFPQHAVVMWTNFKLIPEWFQILFVSVYSSIWGLPIAKEYLGGMFKSLGNAVEARREYKLQQINDKAFFDTLKSGMFGGGLTQEQVDLFNKALKARDNG